MADRKFLMLSKVFDRRKDRIAGMYCSEKLDGERAIWIPETRGLRMKDISCFANIAKGGGTRGKGKMSGAGAIDVMSTGLFTRYGNAIYAPDWFLDKLPKIPLDGELTHISGFQKLRSVVAKQDGSEDQTGWPYVVFNVFDSPTYDKLFTTGRINDTNFKKFIDHDDCMKLINANRTSHYTDSYSGFEFRLRWLRKQLEGCDTYVVLHPQTLLEFSTPVATQQLDEMFEKVIAAGGEGLILRHPASEWEPVRSRFSLKVKQEQDAEARVIGFMMGEGKYEGLIGSVSCEMLDENGKGIGKFFNLSGFTDAERAINCSDYLPKTEMIEWDISVEFKIGDILTYKYREHTDDGIPKEARFKRKI